MSALRHAIRYEVGATLVRRPVVIPYGTGSKLVAHPGDTGPRFALASQPPNPREMAVWAARLGSSSLFVDVGANIGLYSIFAAERGAEVIAVEPSPSRAARLRENLDLNGYEAEVLEVALTEEPGEVRMTTGLDGRNRITEDPSGDSTQTLTLDQVIGERDATVKIDVEGAEHLVLRGATRVMAEKRIRLLQLEWTASDYLEMDDRDALAQLLEEADYDLFLPGKDGNLEPTESIRLVQHPGGEAMMVASSDSGSTCMNVFAMPRP